MKILFVVLCLSCVFTSKNYVVCQETSSTIPPSSSFCPALKNPKNGFLHLSIDISASIPENHSIFPVQTQLMYGCNEGYQLSTNESTRICLPDGRWNGKEPECITECGKPNVPMSSYILNGAPISIYRWPWQAGLYVYKTYQVFCGGSVLNERWVLTGAHCVAFKPDGGKFQQLNYDAYGVFFGHSTSEVNVSLNETIVKRKVWAVIHHQDFNVNTMDSDIALIMLDTPLTFTNAIRPICLPNLKSVVTNDITNKLGIVAGWGETQPNIDNTSLTLRYIHVKIVSNDVCKNANVDKNGFHAPITENMFCARGDKEGSGACMGDGGGSLCVTRGTEDKEVFQIEGIVSFGGYHGCGAPGQYDGYTRVRNFIDWIQSYIN